MINNVFFDLDGTLVNSFEGIANCVIYALDKLGVTPPEKRSLASFIGPPLFESFYKFLKCDDATATTAVEFYRERYNTKGVYEATPYAGINDALRTLKARGKKLFVATSKPEQAAKTVLRHLKLADCFDGIYGASLDKSRAQKAEVIAYALKETGVNPADAVMVGDRYNDIQGAIANGLKSIGVLYGFGAENELKKAGAKFIAPTPLDLVDIILTKI